MDNWNNKQKVIVQLVCILLSLGLWIYVTNIENPIKSYELNNVPVEILNSDSLKDTGLALAPNQNFYVKLKVEGNTQDLFSIDKSDFKITVDLSEFVLKKGENKIAVNIKEAPSTVKIKNSSGLTITVNTEEYSTKEVPVKSEINVISKSSYYVATPVFSPETVVVSGPESLVNKVTKVIAEGEESNAVKTIVKDYIISAVDDNGNEVTGVQLSQKWVEATIEINEGKTVPIKINTTGTLPNGLRLKSISSDTTEIGITGPEEILNNVSEIGTEVIDLSGIKDSTTVEVALGIPDGISIHNGESSIKVNISIDKVQTKEFTISYSIVGTTAEGLTIIPDSDKVTITVSGYADVLNSLTEANFAAELDVSEYTEAGEYTKVPTVNLVGVDNVNIDSVSEVKLTISKDSQTSTNDPNTSTGNTEELNQ
ncbi:MAG: YbbR-like domain-containing protein [Clostridium saudiense]|uniref:CdaR family protein n=1 Tax=Clostridium saudiense TaxID=1414720 RepID=UPI00319D9AFC